MIGIASLVLGMLPLLFARRRPKRLRDRKRKSRGRKERRRLAHLKRRFLDQGPARVYLKMLKAFRDSGALRLEDCAFYMWEDLSLMARPDSDKSDFSVEPIWRFKLPPVTGEWRTHP